MSIALAKAKTSYLLSFWHFWFATVQEVLQADWQDAWHSPQPVCAEALMQGCWMVLMCFILLSSILFKVVFTSVIIHKSCASDNPLYFPSTWAAIAASMPASRPTPKSESSAAETMNVSDRMENTINASAV